jgi:hypothetical protein
LDFSKVGLSTLSDATAFKKIQYFSKVSPQSLYTSSATLDSKYSKLSDLYLKSSTTSNSYNYGTLRQHNYSVSASNQYKQNLLDKKSVDLILNYNHGVTSEAIPSYSGENVDVTKLSSSHKVDVNTLALTSAEATNASLSVASAVEMPTVHNSTNATDDFKGRSNPIKYVDYSKPGHSSYQTSTSDLQAVNAAALPASSDDNIGKTFKFKDSKSPNLGFLSSEKNIRLIDNVNPTKYNASFSKNNNNLEDIVYNVTEESVLPNSSSIYSLSKNAWVSNDRIQSLSSFDTQMTPSHTAVYSNNQEWVDKS